MDLEVGFDTIGNATLLAYDRRPVLVTDPWLSGEAYFGSWTVSHEIPQAQLDAAGKAEFVWVSHGHPDHLSSRSLAGLKTRKLLLPDHVGGRIAASMREQGWDVRILPDRRWVKLSDRIRVMCLADYNQDGILLVDVNGRLIVNLNDASDRGWGSFVRSIVKGYERSFLLKLAGYGDADMIHLFDEAGKPIAPWAARREPVGGQMSRWSRRFGTKYVIPFSAMHKYQRADSVWASQYTTPLDACADGFERDAGELLPPFIRYDCLRDVWEKIAPPERHITPKDPKDFGDDWSAPLGKDDLAACKRYFGAVDHLRSHLDFINLRVGGRDHSIELAGKAFGRGITFEVPRNSLMIAVGEEIFDDLLIGNFMKTTLHGKWPQTGLYPDFTPYLAKYADNGLAKSEDQLRAYFDAYAKRRPLEYLFHRLEERSKDVLRGWLSMDSPAYRALKGIYKTVVGR